MDWSNERYVRLYTRDSADWLVLGWEAQALFVFILRKVDRTGFMQCRLGARGLAALVAMPLDVVERCLPLLLEDGCIETCEGGFIVPNFIEAQEASMTPLARARASRERRRQELRRGIEPEARETAIYFIRAADGTGPIKIGHAEDTAKRLIQLQNGRADPLSLLVAVPGTTDDEKALHSAFAEVRIKGEWFAASTQLLGLIAFLSSGGKTGADAVVWAQNATKQQSATSHDPRPNNETQPVSPSRAVPAVPTRAVPSQPEPPASRVRATPAAGDDPGTPGHPDADTVSATARTLCVAANLAIAARYGEQTRPLRPGHGHTVALTQSLLEAHVPLEFAAEAIRSLVATRSDPEPPGAMTWFAKGIIRLWGEEQARRDAASGTAPGLGTARSVIRGNSFFDGLRAEIEKGARS